MENFKDPSTGERIIQAIYKREDVYSGIAMKEAPDLTLVLRDYGFVSIKNILPIVEPRQTPAGTHHPDGIFLAGGYGIKPGFKGERQNIVDVTATMIYSLGLPIPKDQEGCVAENFFTENYLQSKPIAVGEKTSLEKSTDDESENISDEEKEKILAQLQMLGYME